MPLGRKHTALQAVPMDLDNANGTMFPAMFGAKSDFRPDSFIQDNE